MPKKDEFPKHGVRIPTDSFQFFTCCDCGLTHANYYVVLRGKKMKDDAIFMNCERDETATKYWRAKKHAEQNRNTKKKS